MYLPNILVLTVLTMGGKKEILISFAYIKSGLYNFHGDF